MDKEPHYTAFLYAHETEVHLAYYSAIGRVCAIWSNLEFQLDVCAHSLFDVLGGNQFMKLPPHSFDQRVELWKDCFKKLPALSSHKAQALKFASDMKSASTDRNTLVHTHWGSLLNNKPPLQLVGNSITPKRGKYFLKGAKIEYRRIIAFTDHLGGLNTRMLPFLFHITSQRNALSAAPHPDNEAEK